MEIPKFRVVTETAETAAKRMLEDPNTTPEQTEYKENAARVIASTSVGFKDNLDEFYSKMNEARVKGAINAAKRGEITLYKRRTLQVGSKQIPLPSAKVR